MASMEARLKYAINNNDAKIDKIKIGNRKGLQNVVIIGDKRYQYNPNKISKLLTTKLNQLTTTSQFNATQQIKKISRHTIKKVFDSVCYQIQSRCH